MCCPFECFVMTKSVRQHKIVKSSKLKKSESSLICVRKCLASFHKHPCPLLHSSLVAQVCPFSMSDQWHSVAGHIILLLRCRHSLTLGRMLVLLWCWKGLPSGGWWWACWRLGVTPWQCSRCPCEQVIQRHVHVYHLFHWRKLRVLPLLLFCKVLSTPYTDSEDVPSVSVHFVC